MFNFRFDPISNSEVSTATASNVVTLSGIVGSILISVSGEGAQMIVNGNPETGDFAVSTGDTLQLGTTSSPIPGNTVHATVNFGDSYWSTFSVTTAPAIDTAFLVAYSGNSLVEFDPVYQGVTAASNNRIFSVTDAGTTTETAIVPSPTADPASLGTEADFMYLADYHGDAIHRFDTDLSLVHSISVDKPYSCSYTPTEIAGEVEVDILVSSPLTGLVSILKRTSNYSVHKTVNVGGEPHGVVGDSSALDSGKISFWVARRSANTIERWERDNATDALYSNVETFVMPADSGVTELFLDEDGQCWGTLSKSNQVVRCIRGTAPDFFTVGNGPGFITGDATYVYISNVEDASISKINRSTGSVIALVACQAGPGPLSIYNDKLYIVGIDSGKVERYNSAVVTPTYIDTVTIGKHGFGAMTYGTEVHIPCMYEDAQDRTGQPGSAPDGLNVEGAFVTRSDIPPETTITSTKLDVTGLDAPSYIEVPAIYGATIVLNGVDTGQTSATIDNGDEVRIRMITDADGRTFHYIPISSPGASTVWIIEGDQSGGPVDADGYLGGA